MCLQKYIKRTIFWHVLVLYMRQYLNNNTILNRYTISTLFVGILFFMILYNIAYGYFDYMESIYIISIVYWGIFFYGFKVIKDKSLQ